MLLNDESFSTADAVRLLDRLAGSGSGTGRTGMPMDIHRFADHVVAAFDLPGVDPGSLDVTVEGNALTVRAERAPLADADAEWLVAERPRGTYERRLLLGHELDTDGLTAAYRNGVLEITLPIVERAKPRRLAIDHDDARTPERQVIEAPAR